MSTHSNPTKRPATAKKRIFAAFARILAIFENDPEKAKRSDMWIEAQSGLSKHGKHNGRTPGAFGGKGRCKAHRKLYVNPEA